MEGERDGRAVVPEPNAVIFIAPAHPADLGVAPFFFGRKASKPKDRLRVADEDGARRALGPDGLPQAAASPAASIEHLARVALG